jgi:uncharacterized protein DUF5671
MAVNTELPDFVRDSLAKGLSREEIETVLLRAGWDGDQVRGALCGFANIGFPIPVPRPKPYLSAREAFMYVVLFSTLYVSAFNLGSLLFDFINETFPDPAMRGPGAYAYAGYARESMRWSVSSLLVAFPVFLYVSRFINRAVRADARKRGSRVRYQLTYLTLFLAGSCLVGDVIALVYNFLGGELTVRFVLKVLAVGIIAGPVFGYYLWDLRRDETEIGGES